MFDSTGSKARNGYSLLDVQIAFAVLGIALAGLVPMAIAQIRLMNRIEARMRLNQTQFLVPSANAWARKLGVAARVTVDDPGPTLPSVPNTAANVLQVEALSSSTSDDSATALIRVTPVPPPEEEE